MPRRHRDSLDQLELPLRVVDHEIEWLDISVHDTLGMAVVEGFEQFVHVEAL